MTEGEPKTRSSVAQVALDVAVMKLLRIHRQRQREEEEAWAGSWQNAAGRIFCREDSSSLQPDSVRR
ncbi:hypothetical protein [Nonomuraea endophytica]|uniref:hypothetical protein n=1 Tax=Nonomuraea endophytica TaxID=714136 RepID=UPI0037C590B5